MKFTNLTMKDGFNLLLNIFKYIIKLAPILLLIAIVVIFLLCKKNKVKIKWKTLKSKTFRPVRGIWGLFVYNGKQGMGKTYSIAEYLYDNAKSITVFCNINDITSINYLYFKGFKELLMLKDVIDYKYISYEDLKLFCINLGFDEARGDTIANLIIDMKLHKKQLVFVYDEIFTELIKGSKLSKPVIDFLCQMRKRQIIFLTTCQEWAELPLSFRRFCRFEIDCKMIPFLWTGFLVKTFKDAENMKWSNEDQEHIAPLVETTITKTRKIVADSYDTFLRISSTNLPSSGNAEHISTGEEEII